jgi:hypothetical protein
MSYTPEYDTKHLTWNEATGMIDLRNEDGDDIPLGPPGEQSQCPAEYIREWRELVRMVEDADATARHYDATRRHADEQRHSPERW